MSNSPQALKFRVATIHPALSTNVLTWHDLFCGMNVGSYVFLVLKTTSDKVYLIRLGKMTQLKIIKKKLRWGKDSSVYVETAWCVVVTLLLLLFIFQLFFHLPALSLSLKSNARTGNFAVLPSIVREISSNLESNETMKVWSYVKFVLSWWGSNWGCALQGYISHHSFSLRHSCQFVFSQQFIIWVYFNSILFFWK